MTSFVDPEANIDLAASGKPRGPSTARHLQQVAVLQILQHICYLHLLFTTFHFHFQKLGTLLENILIIMSIKMMAIE